ncbi:MAG: 1-aminocyclopropane-1-carboxylate deaminase [Mesorhizobium amorphae]|nr:MAG: 1-aminocyclopropane-1-carboxylate deaminase [Mesorhizobium amorphae]
MDILAEANRLRAGGQRVVSMAVGQPSDPAPQAVRDAAARALGHGAIGYTDALGLADLREAIAAHYREHYGIAVSPGRVVVTTGSSAGFNLAFLAMFDAGDRVAIASPGYPAYRNIMRALGLDVVEVELDGAPFLDADHLRAAHAEKPLRGLLFASPANPTGAALPPEALAHLLDTARELGIAVISDEIYHRLNHAGPDTTALAFDDEAVIINSFSKYYCMTGWRIGWMVVPEGMVRAVERIAQSLYISAPELSQRAAIEAFGASAELEAVKQRYARSRALLQTGLPALGFRFAAPMDGAFYAYCDVSGLSNDSMEFAKRMLREAGVAATPGAAFDTRSGARFMRFSYAGSDADVSEALSRMGSWLNGN